MKNRKHWPTPSKIPPTPILKRIGVDTCLELVQRRVGLAGSFLALEKCCEKSAKVIEPRQISYRCNEFYQNMSK